MRFYTNIVFIILKDTISDKSYETNISSMSDQKSIKKTFNEVTYGSSKSISINIDTEN